MRLTSTEIPHRLQAIDSASFQILINQYLRLSDSSILSITPNGGHAYKLKTTTGQPDAQFWLKDGRMLWAEYTTIEGKTKIVRKFKEDIDGCEEEREKLGLKPEEIRELKLCYTDDLTTAQQQDLKFYGKARGFQVTYLGLGTLTADLQNKYPGLAKLFLSVSIGTGQLFLRKQFVDYYTRHGGGITTPLDNPFKGRRTEIKALKEQLDVHPVVCMTGQSGVGKTRLVLETLKELSQDNRRPVFVLSNNGQDVYQDLCLWFDNLDEGYLLVEDANRQLDNLKQVISFLKQSSDKQFSIILTVRNYAREAVEQCLTEVDTGWESIGIITDEEIREIVAAAPYYIRKDSHQWDISRLVQGNIRFALMIARLLKDKKIEEFPTSFLELFEVYFSSYVQDFADLISMNYLKTLGVFAMVRAIDLGTTNDAKNREVLADFDIDFVTFKQCLGELRRRELITQRFDVAILSEQVFASYFFYLAFIKHKVLEFGKAMEYEFNQYHYTKVSEHINEIGQRFGTQIVLDAIEGDLLNYEDALISDPEWDQYFTVFWRFREEKLIRKLRIRIDKLPKGQQQDFPVAIDNTTVNYYVRSNELRLLSNLFQSEGTTFQKALHLAFRYIKRQPEALLGLIKSCKEKILLRSEGTIADSERQRYLFKYLFDGIAGGQVLSTSVFLSVVGFYLSHVSSIHEYQFAATEAKLQENNGKQLRLRIWEQLYHLYQMHPDVVVATLKQLSNGRYGQITKRIFSIDIHWSGKIVDDFLVPEEVGNAAMVHELMYALEQFQPGVDWGQKKIDAIKERFETSTLQTLIDLGWRFWYYRKDNKLGVDDQRKEHDEYLRKQYLFSDVETTKMFAAKLAEIAAADLLIGFELHRGLDSILRVNLEHNLDVGQLLIEKWLKLDLPLNREMVTYIGEQPDLINIYLQALDVLPEAHCRNRFWFFAQSISPELITSTVRGRILKVINNLPRQAIVDFRFLQKVAENEEELLAWIYSLQEQLQNGKQFHYFGEEEMVKFLLQRDLTLTKSFYLDHLSTDHLFDYTLDVLLKILTQDPSFVVDYVQAEFVKVKSGRQSGRERQFGRVWSVPEILNHFSSCADLILQDKDLHFLGDGSFNVLFGKVDDQQKKAMKPFVIDYLLTNLKDRRRLRLILDGIKTMLPQNYPEAVYRYLDSDNSVETFRAVKWTPSGGTFSANANVSRWRKQNWEGVYELIEEYNGEKNISAILEEIQQKIDACERDAREEDKRMFGYGSS